MLGENIGSVGWPTCGEIDIMENFGTFNNNVSINNGTAHGPGYSGNGIGKSYRLPFSEKVADEYHLYAIEWSQDSIEWFVDGASYHKVTPASLSAGRLWVFNNPFFILLNLAIGGPTTFLGTPDLNVPFAAQDMLVDYVRVYERTQISSETPVITPGRVVNAASYLGSIAPGSLAAVFGSNFADAARQVSPAPNFPTSIDGVMVTVDGVSAPLIYVSATQINFQIPWGTPSGTAVNVKVTRDGLDSNTELITITDTRSPSMFLNEYTNGVAWVTGSGCEATECTVQEGVQYVSWGNGFGPKNSPQQDGVPATYSGSVAALQVPGGPASCLLIIGGQPARVDYCGVAPSNIIDQLNFAYPDGVVTDSPYADASLTINGVTGRFRVPAPVPNSDQRADHSLADDTRQKTSNSLY